MIKKMLVNATHPEENRVAIVEDGILSELDIEIAGQEQTKGNIYKAAVVRVEPGLQAAFVDYGAERLGFLQSGELHPSLYPKRDDEENKSRPRINEILHRGQELLVQITKEERGNKGAALTTFLSLPGRYMVLMPEDDARGISRKIPDGAERKALRQAIAAMDIPENMGIIVRTAAIGKTSEELQRDLDYLLKLYGNITSHADQTKAPALIYQESNLVIRSIRDYFMPDMDEVLIDDTEVFNEAKKFFAQVMPDHANLVKLHQEQRPIFSKYQIEEQIETIAHSQVGMPSGGSIVIDQTEALVAIDVNSGKMSSEQGIEATAFKSNLEAASEVARQLRLRDLGGLVVIDFIDMRDRKHIREVEKRLKEALKNDKARVTVGRISQFGLLEMSRQRIKQSLAAAAWNDCPQCKGRGKVKSTEAQAVAIMRKIHAAVAKKQIERVEARVPAEVAEYLLNTRREELLDVERRYKTAIYLSGGSELAAEEVEFEFKKREKRASENKDESAPVTAATALAETTTERAHQPAEDKADEEAAQPHAPAQKKRSRRGRGGSSAKSDASNQEQATEENPSNEQASTDESAAPSAETTGEEAPRRRRRRRRGRRGGGQAAAEATTESAESAESAATEATGTAEATESTEATEPPAPASEEAQPKRRGRRRKPAAADQPEPATESAPVTAEESPAPENKKDSETGTAAEEQPTKPKRRRSPRKKSVTAPTEAVESAEKIEPASASQPQQEEAPGEDAQSKPKRRRAPRKKSEETPATESADTEQLHPPEEQPKPRRRGRPKKSTDKVEATPSTDAVKAETSVAVTEESKPKRRRRAAPKSQEAEKPSGSAPEATEAAAEADKPKPARRTRTKKVIEPTEQPTPSDTEKPAAKPRKKPVRSKKTDAAKPESSTVEPAAKTEGDPEQKPKPRRRSPRKKTTSDTPTEE